MDFNFGFLPLVKHSLIVIIFVKGLFTNFSSRILFRCAMQSKVDLPINFGGCVGTSLDPSRMLHLSHSRRTFCHKWNIAFINNKSHMHSFVDSTFSMGFNVSSNFCTTCKTTRRINNRSKKKEYYITYCDLLNTMYSLECQK